MLKDGKIWMANNDKGENIFILPKMANRHGLVAGATGTGKTITLKVMAESFSDMGVPVFMADVKGDIAGMMCPGVNTEDMQKRIQKFGLAEAGFEYKGYPVTIWDIFGKKGIPLRTTVSEIGPLLMARILELNDLQSAILNIVYKIADDNQLLLIDTKDLKAMLNFVNENRIKFEAEYGKMSPASITAIIRAIVALETQGADVFFGEPALSISDWLTQDCGRGMINILDSEILINNGRLPKMVFFFDEAHLLFNGASKALLEKIEQVVKLIRSKGVGIYFCTQSPKDIPDGVLAQLGNKVQHALRAYTPADQRAVKAAAASYRPNPAFDTASTIMELGTGKAVVSFLEESGIPGMVQKVSILPPQCSMGSVSDAQRDQAIKASLLYSKYSGFFDRDSAYEFLQRQQQVMAKEAEEAKAAAEQARIAEKEAKEAALAKEKAEKEAAREAERAEAEKNRMIKSVGGSVLGTVGRQVGRTLGGSVAGNVGKTVGGSLGASLIRGIFGTFFKG